MTPEERFWSKVNKTETCWLWTAQISTNGYGGFWNGKRGVAAHRFSYELAKGPIPEGLHIDHLCRVRHCVNPDHLEAVTPAENTLRGIGPTAVNASKTHCSKGHRFDAENTFIRPDRGTRDCKECKREEHRAYVAVKVECPTCGLRIYRGNLRRHEAAKHTEAA